MRFQAGRKPGTLDLIQDSFREGMNLSAVEHMHPEYGLVRSALYIENYEITPWGDLRTRPDGSRITLIDPETCSALEESCLRLLPYHRVDAGMELVLVTPTRLFWVDPYRSINLREITISGGHAFRVSAEPGRVDSETYQGKLYIAAAGNPLIEWNGRDEARYVSTSWPSGYQYPTTVRRHMGRLFVSGFMDVSDTRAQSQLRWTRLADVDHLEDYVLEIRTTDDDSPVAMASLQSGLATTDQAGARSTAALLVWKSRNTLAATGADWANLSDVEVHPHTPGVGCVGPAAWTWGGNGLYFCSPWGVYRISGLQPAEAVSQAIAPIFGREAAHTQVVHPCAQTARLRETVLWANPETRQVFVHLPVHPVTA